ncbi:head GIN domain-containing protein [Hymenobacter sp. BT730]|uniref:head GIN domain-containing protein n=1 Tax=Hymenobacter sp. BT730 TaxID=3063332 RepID=UPI0026DEFFA1|nr:head GIN domain-containing protein [Hymenobacter sp. BT730]
MKNSWLLLPLLSTLVFTSCDNDISGPRIHGTGPTVAEVRTLNSFKRVELSIDAEVVLTQGSPQQVRVEAQRNVLDVLETEIDGSELQIEFGHVNVRRHDPIKVYITVPELTEVQLSGTGKIRSDAPLTTSNCKVEVSGTGVADLNFAQVTELQTTLTGSGEIRLSGSGQSHKCSSSGSGQVSAYDFKTQDTNVSITGSGQSYVQASHHLNVEITGSGNVFYKGSPMVNTRITGSGRVQADN